MTDMHMAENLQDVLWMLSIAMLVAMAARRLKLPYTIGLVFIGALLALTPINVGPTLTSELILDLILPPLLFEAALALKWPNLRAELTPILTFSVLGTLLALAAVAAGLIYLLHWPPGSALVFGALISATDPVAIIAMFKDNNFHGRLSLLVEAESLFNDAAAAVLFAMALSWALASGEAGGHTPDTAETVLTLARIVLGGLGVGVIAGAGAILLSRGTSEHLVELTFSTIAAFGSFLAAEHIRASGVLATVTAGLIVGNFGIFSANDRSLLSARGREAMVNFWEFAAFLANSVIFLLIGANVAVMDYKVSGVVVIAGVIGLVLAARAVAVYPLSLLFHWSRHAISLSQQLVLWWGGLRGALGLALALSLPPTLPLREEIVVVTFAVVAFSIVVQGMTMPWLLRRLGLL
ncbi:cation:proton antiporter [Rhodoblastus acidophilus]|uniref:Cation:proton antiporter n=1 Tax=Candidatus Rhodoblastus alkanivorans TaxID=2954117 RepID=A0ABS9Z8S2_9HYPH|nr:cation:proton antiporter [Candidatus Rhodoblastus alkanivorans]MCI4680350.1 cation:proton antiporter [Candidatus Rhodoblastus alkanivorans]MCI4683997.1 cation:proton antiporter [Candidatus Rhodoblastus alkanivorans]MDI4641316.1 cation:proton antiporter [Rhodoblastus acidophilus]